MRYPAKVFIQGNTQKPGRSLVFNNGLADVNDSSGPISRALESNITSHLPGCGVRWLLIHQVKSSSRAQFSKLQATPCEEPVQKTVVSSAYIKVSPDLIDEGKSFVKGVNKVGPNTEPCGTPQLTYIFEDCFQFIVVNCFRFER